MQRLPMAAILWIGMTLPAWTLTVEERLTQGLQAQGYTILELGYTFLGRLRIVAESDEIHREIVVNPGTGEILRDYAIYLSDMPSAPHVASGNGSDSRDRNDKPATSSGSAANVNVASADPAPTPARTRADRPRNSATGTAGVAVSSLEPGSSTLGIASIEVDNTRTEGPLLDATILPMAPGKP